jgi:hypothetical protein
MSTTQTSFAPAQIPLVKLLAGSLIAGLGIGGLALLYGAATLEKSILGATVIGGLAVAFFLVVVSNPTSLADVQPTRELEVVDTLQTGPELESTIGERPAFGGRRRAVLLLIALVLCVAICFIAVRRQRIATRSHSLLPH